MYISKKNSLDTQLEVFDAFTYTIIDFTRKGNMKNDK